MNKKLQDERDELALSAREQKEVMSSLHDELELNCANVAHTDEQYQRYF